MFKTVIETARRANADYVGYRAGVAKSITIVDVAAEDVIANTSFEGRDIFIAGVAARGQSYLDYATGQFMCGTAAQMMEG